MVVMNKVITNLPAVASKTVEGQGGIHKRDIPGQKQR